MGSTFQRIELGNDDEPLSEEVLSQTPGFQNRAELDEVMRDPRYKGDPAYRQIVARALQHTNPSILNLPDEEARRHRTRGVDMVHGEDIEMKKELVQARFKDPRYKSSAVFRAETARLIQEHSEDAAALNGTNRVSLTGERGKVGSLQNLGCLHVQLETKSTGPNRPAPQPKAPPKDDGSIDIAAQGFHKQ